MRVDNILNRVGVSYNELKAVNKDSVLSSDDALENSKAVEQEFTKQVTEDIASRNVTAQNVQNEVTKYQIAKGNLIKQNEKLQELKEFVIQNKESNDFEIANEKFNSLVNEIDFLSDKAVYQGEKLFDMGADHQKFEIPSVRVGGKNFLPLHNVEIGTREDLNNALAVVEGAISKVSNEIAQCITTIDELSSKAITPNEINYIDASVARELMKSLKSEIYTKGLEAIKAQSAVETNNTNSII